MLSASFLMSSSFASLESNASRVARFERNTAFHAGTNVPPRGLRATARATSQASGKVIGAPALRRVRLHSPAMLDLLPSDLSTPRLAFLLASAFVAATARGFSGFGAALIFLPLAATVVDPKIASPLLLITDAVLALGFIPHAWRTADKREVGLMGLGAAFGIPLGAYLLVRLDPVPVRWAM